MRTILRGAAMLLAALVLVLVGPAAAANATTPDHGHVSDQDKAFLVAAHQSNLAEIATGALAERKGASKEVRDLGKMFVTDHTRLDADLKKVADKLGVHLPSQPNAEQRAFAAKVAKLSGSSFDRQWLAGQITAHCKAKANGEKEIAKGSNHDVIKIAKTSAPVIQHHLDELQDISSNQQHQQHHQHH
jgi:putative membrane protein